MLVHLSGKNVGAFLARWNGVIMLLQAVTLPVSGYVLDHYSPFWLIVVTVSLLAISLLPLFRLHVNELPNNRRRLLSALLRTGEGQYIAVANHINEILTKIPDTLLPLFIFITFSSFLSVGIAGVLTTVAGAFYAYLVSDWSEQKSRRQRILGYNILGSILVLILLAAVPAPFFVFVAVVLLVLLRLGTCLSVTVGINQICLREDCYALKMFGRMSMNFGGMLIGLLIIFSGLVSFPAAFLFLAGYIIVAGGLVYRLRRFI